MKLELITIITLIIILCILIVLFPKKQKPDFRKLQSGKCSSSCGSGHLDPINDPDYNVREAIKQTLLLEQHLAEKAKYCKSCSCKHQLLIIGLLSEAVWMSCNHCKDYPKLEESVDFFQKLFEKWHANMDDDQTRLDTLTELRIWRREMIDLYYFKDKVSDSHS
jgi:hypothetical protein